MNAREIEARFWEKVDWDPRNEDRCWPWTASKMWRGYGQFRLTDVQGNQCVARAHRLAYEFTFGPIPATNAEGEPIHVDHVCHDPRVCQAGEACPHRACCNPFHMKLTSNRGNHLPGRVDGATGGRTAAAALTPEERVAMSRRAHAARWPEKVRLAWTTRMRQWWAELPADRRAEISAKISASKAGRR